jgi:hypothetical protein
MIGPTHYIAEEYLICDGCEFLDIAELDTSRKIGPKVFCITCNHTLNTAIINSKAIRTINVKTPYWCLEI